jgi:hypothetical protein
MVDLIRGALAVLLFLAASAGAQAQFSPNVLTVVQTANSTGNGAGNVSLSFTNAPANGDVVIALVSSPTTITLPTSVTDSNSVGLTDEGSQTHVTFAADTWDYVVSGAPTKTYTCNSATTSCTNVGLIEIRSANTPGSFTGANGATSTPTKARGAATKFGSLQTCVMAATTSQTMTYSGLLTTTTLYTTTTANALYGMSTGLVANACTGSQTATSWALSLGGWTSANTSICPPGVYPCLFQTGMNP